MLAHRLISQGKQLSFAECLQMEFRVVNRLMHGKDFFEGVRALLVDKDNSPKWQPASLDQVKSAVVDAHFAPLSPNEELVLQGSVDFREYPFNAQLPGEEQVRTLLMQAEADGKPLNYAALKKKVLELKGRKHGVLEKLECIHTQCLEEEKTDDGHKLVWK